MFSVVKRIFPSFSTKRNRFLKHRRADKSEEGDSKRKRGKIKKSTKDKGDNSIQTYTNEEGNTISDAESKGKKGKRKKSTKNKSGISKQANIHEGGNEISDVESKGKKDKRNKHPNTRINISVKENSLLPEDKGVKSDHLDISYNDPFIEDEDFEFIDEMIKSEEKQIKKKNKRNKSSKIDEDISLGKSSSFTNDKTVRHDHLIFSPITKNREHEKNSIIKKSKKKNRKNKTPSIDIEEKPSYHSDSNLRRELSEQVKLDLDHCKKLMERRQVSCLSLSQRLSNRQYTTLGLNYPNLRSIRCLCDGCANEPSCIDICQRLDEQTSTPILCQNHIRFCNSDRITCTGTNAIIKGKACPPMFFYVPKDFIFT